MKPLALVVAPGYDRPTKYLTPSARRIEDILKLSGYEVMTFLGDAACVEQLYAALAEVKASKTRKIVVAVFCAHGTEKELRARKGLLADKYVFQELRNSIVILCACVPAGKLAIEISDRMTGVRAVVGYQDCMKIPPADSLAKLLGKWADRGHRRFTNAAIQPIVSLVLGRESVSSAVISTQRVWYAMSGNRRLKKTLRVCCWINAKNVRFWRNPEDALVSLR